MKEYAPLLTKQRDNKEITEEVGDFLVQETPRTAQFYSLPKSTKACRIRRIDK